MKDIKRLYQSFYLAASGIRSVNGTNFKIMVGIGISVISASFILQIPTPSKLIILIIASLVLSLEIVNTALEKYIDSQNLGINKNIRLLKNMLAGAVLISCMFSVIIGVIIFWVHFSG